MRAPTIRIVNLLTVTTILLSLGCASTQLRKISVRQANSVADIYEQQVLDNLAKFVVNPYSTPSFSVAVTSTNGVNDKGTLDLSKEFLTGNLWDHIAMGGERSLARSFLFNPVSDPKRLQLMQCAYQAAVGLPKDECNKCCRLLEEWTGVQGECEDCCGITSGWICRSKDRRDVPKCCQKHAEFCGVYVWVDPCQQREFAKLMNAIIDFASGAQKEPKTTIPNATLYLDADFNPVPYGQHVMEVKASLVETELKKDEAIAAKQREIDELRATTSEFDRQIEKLAPSGKKIDEQQFQSLDKSFLNDVGDKLDLMNESSYRASRDAMLSEMERELQKLKADNIRKNLKSVAPESRTDFGPPTQFNGFYNNNLLQQQQLLNIVPGNNR